MVHYAIDRSRKLCLLPEATKTFDTFRTSREVEAGGILLGRVYPSEVDIEVATPPNVADKAGRYFFDRSRAAAQAIVNTAWTASGGERIYLGEWHSHLADVAEPSNRDRKMILNMLRESDMHIDFLILVVLGRQKDWVGLAHDGVLRRLMQNRHP